ncbi:MAG TPA: GH1 family beta-glucosidase [Gemmatimonadales bacterium]|nr:GH1 family beta-glucosidase [Gemmatimonadales bacterium]
MSDPAPAPPRFPEDFLWGAATSAYQVEGSPLADGAGPSIWHRFSHSPGLTAGGETGDVACDHYRRWSEDVALMAELGLNAYRFSLSWSRILPDGRGRVNQAGLDFYSRLVDALLAKNIQPNVTLYHWDLPAALDDRGGWLSPDSPGWFADYARVAFKALGDRVKMWATLNEPWVVVDGGYLHGALAPGHRNIFEAPRVAHHLLLSHGAGVQAYRAEGRGKIGIVVNIEPKHAASQDPGDLAAVRRADAYMNRQYLEPVLGHPYPAELADIYGPGWDERVQQDIPKIAQPIDFLGINYYTRGLTRNDPSAAPVRTAPVRVPGAAYTETGWEVYPAGLTETLLWVKERAGGLPLYVTENGAAFPDPQIEDHSRVSYYREHLRAALDARRQGVDLRGYFAWSLLDNFEWSLGYAKRFGIVHVDFTTQKRTLKASARAYRDVITSRGGVLAD